MSKLKDKRVSNAVVSYCLWTSIVIAVISKYLGMKSNVIPVISKSCNKGVVVHNCKPSNLGGWAKGPEVQGQAQQLGEAPSQEINMSGNVVGLDPQHHQNNLPLLKRPETRCAAPNATCGFQKGSCIQGNSTQPARYLAASTHYCLKPQSVLRHTDSTTIKLPLAPQPPHHHQLGELQQAKPVPLRASPLPWRHRTIFKFLYPKKKKKVSLHWEIGHHSEKKESKPWTAANQRECPIILWSASKMLRSLATYTTAHPTGTSTFEFCVIIIVLKIL